MSEKILIIGAVALGPKAACRYKRLNPDGEVVMIDAGKRISYGGCGIPYYVSGDVADASGLQSTSFHMLRDERFFRDAKGGVIVRTGLKATAIDRAAKQVRVTDVDSGAEELLPYDKLVLGTGSRPRRLNVPGEDLPGVHTVGCMDDAIAIKAKVQAGQVERAVIIGAGFIGLEMAEALADMWDIEVTVVEARDQILPGLVGSGLSRIARKHMEDKGVSFRFGQTVRAIEEGEEGGLSVVTADDAITADLVVVSIGVVPNSELARTAGLSVSPRGGILVDEYMRTSDSSIYAGGDCVEVYNILTGKPVHLPMGSLANRQGRVIGSNLAGRSERFEGVVGSFVVKLFDMVAGGAGLSLERAQAEGFDAIRAHISQFDRAHFILDKDMMYLDLIVERGTRRILGLQGVGGKGDGLSARIDAIAAILPHAPVTADVSNLELAYSPPFSSAMDILNAAANTADNILDGFNKPIDLEDFEALWADRANNGLLVLDCRGWANAESYVNRFPDFWRNIPQDELPRRLAEVPQDRKLVLICNAGVRSYEAQRTLDHAGVTETVGLQGGMASALKADIKL